MWKIFGAANCVTLARFLLVIAINSLLEMSHGQSKMLIFILSFLVLNYIGDVLDGYLARRLNQVTKLGAIMDVSVDGLLLLGAYFILGYKGVINYDLFSLTLISLLQFILSSLWVKKFNGNKQVFTFDALGHYSAVLMESVLIFNIAAAFIIAPAYVKTIDYVDLIVTCVAVAATLNRFRFYFMIPKTLEA